MQLATSIFTQVLLTIIIVTCIVSNTGVSSLDVCKRYEACRIVISEYDIAPTTTTSTQAPVTEVEGSGSGSIEGSGISATVVSDSMVAISKVIPYYDEFFMDQMTQHLENSLVNATTTLTEHDLCSCPGDTQCGQESSDEDNSLPDDATKLSVDQFTTLQFCQPVTEALPRVCHSAGRRPTLRIFGTLFEKEDDEKNEEKKPAKPAPVDPMTTYFFSSYSSTQAFCRCPKGYVKATQIEAWSNGQKFAFAYYCE